MIKWIKKFFETPVINLIGTRDIFVKEREADPEPWAIFEVIAIDESGKVKVEFNWNKAFIQRLDELGFTSETEEDTVQLFFYASQMHPTTLSGDESVQIADLPELSSPVNRA